MIRAVAYGNGCVANRGNHKRSSHCATREWQCLPAADRYYVLDRTYPGWADKEYLRNLSNQEHRRKDIGARRSESTARAHHHWRQWKHHVSQSFPRYVLLKQAASKKIWKATAPHIGSRGYDLQYDRHRGRWNTTGVHGWSDRTVSWYPIAFLHPDTKKDRVCLSLPDYRVCRKGHFRAKSRKESPLYPTANVEVIYRM